MSNHESQNEAPLLEKQVSLDIRHANKQGRGQRKPQRQFAQPSCLIRVEGIALPSDVAERKNKKYGEECPNQSANVHNVSSFLLRLPVTANTSKLDFGSEPEDNSTLDAASDIRVVLNHGLQEHHGSNIEKRIELDSLLGLPCRRSGWKEV
jgi:hypothetical protein